ncbi:hypothetical protein ACI0FM_08585 [Paenochrobactrum sp. BZR 588]|uniref:hypothetical protein n=1 Tax=Paenochrobactrum TaxID=999488 RepID=UPI0035BBC858
MPFTNGPANGVFVPEDLVVMQKAYEITCNKLNICPKTYEEKNRIARLVMRVFRKGENNPHAIALQTVALETTYNSLMLAA